MKILILAVLSAISQASAAGSVQKGAVTPQVIANTSKSLQAYFNSSAPDIGVIQAALPVLRAIDLEDPKAKAAAEPILAVISNEAKAASYIKIGPEAPTAPTLIARAEKLAVLNGALRLFVPEGLQAGVEAAANLALESVAAEQRERIDSKMKAIAEALGGSADPGETEASAVVVAPMSSGQINEAARLMPARGSYANRTGYGGISDNPSARDIEFAAWKARAQFRYDSAKPGALELTIMSIVTGLGLSTFGVIVGALFFGVFTDVPTGGSLIWPIMIIGMLAGFGITFASSRGESERQKAANAAADEAQAALGIPVNVDQIPSTPEEIARARRLYEFSLTHEPVDLPD